MSIQRKGAVIAASLGVVLVLGFAIVAAGLFGAGPAAAPSSSGLRTAAGGTQQWAFGGSVGVAFSCTVTTCATDFNLTSGNVSLSFSYFIEWVVIYSSTNVSGTQVMNEAQAALNASVSASFSDCIYNVTSHGCDKSSLSLNLNGRETAVGFTNITNTGTVLLTPSGSFTASSVPAWAVMDSSSNDAFNFSGSYSASGPSSTGTQSGTVSFDIGGQETSGVTFSTPLGLVPLTPHPGDTWNASAPYSAHGSYSSGASITYNVPGHSGTVGNWTHGSVSPMGTLTVNGTDLGQFTLWDNYTNPHTSITAQAILLDFGSGAFVGSDGWLLIPAGLYGGAFTGIGLAQPARGLSPAIGSTPSALGTPTGENAYYTPSQGFIGASLAQNVSVPLGGTGTASPKVSLTAGPEPVSVAQQQYSAITSNPASTSSFPLTLLIVAVVVVVVVVVALVLVMRRSARRRPPLAAAPPVYTPMGAYPGGAPGPTGPSPGSVPPSPTGPAPGQPGQ